MSDFVIHFNEVPNFADDLVWVEFVDASGAAYDWTGSTFELRIGASRSGSAPAATLTQGDGDVVPSIVDGKSRITFRFRPEKMSGLAAGTYQLDLVRTVSSRPQLFGTGTAKVIRNVGA